MGVHLRCSARRDAVKWAESEGVYIFFCAIGAGAGAGAGAGVWEGGSEREGKVEK